jgi:hypothetical protein
MDDLNQEAARELREIEGAVMSVVLSREGMRRYRNGDSLTLDPSDLRDTVRLTVAKVEARRASPAIPQGDDLPPLPEPDVIGYTCIGENDAYSPAKVREYGAACRASKPVERKPDETQ